MEGLLGRQVEQLVPGIGKRPVGLGALGEAAFSGGVVEAGVALAEAELDFGLLAGSPAGMVVAFEEGVQERLLELGVVGVVEGQVVAADDEAEELVLGACAEPSDDVAAEVEKDSSLEAGGKLQCADRGGFRHAYPVGYAQDRNLDVLEVELFLGVVVLVPELVICRVDGLVLSVAGQHVFGQIDFQGVVAPAHRRSSGTAVLILDNSVVPPKGLPSVVSGQPLIGRCLDLQMNLSDKIPPWRTRSL